MSKKNMIVARIQQHTSASIGKSERHNERKNETYENINVDPKMIRMNVHYRDPCGESYYDIFNKKVASGEISTRGLRESATLFDEMIIDVNTMYFEERGGYDYAVRFYEEAYHFAEELYGTENIVSAVMHADEINKAATEEFGYPIYHYHLHVIAIPVVEKEIRYSKRCKDSSLRGTVKETIRQVSHSKKWGSRVQEKDEEGNPVYRSDGKPRYVKSYSVLQDKVYEFMQDKGFTDIERGNMGSGAEHLSSLQYQIKQDRERKRQLSEEIKRNTVEYETVMSEHSTAADIEKISVKKTLTGKVQISSTEFDQLKGLAKEGVSSRARIRNLEQSNSYYSRQIYKAEEKVYQLEEALEKLQKKCKPYLEALHYFPEAVKNFLDDLMLQIRIRNKLKEKGIPLK